MIRQQSVLEVVSGEHSFSFTCGNDAPLGQVFDALSQMRAYVIERIQQSQPVAAPEAPAAQPAVVDVPL